MIQNWKTYFNFSMMKLIETQFWSNIENRILTIELKYLITAHNCQKSSPSSHRFLYIVESRWQVCLHPSLSFHSFFFFCGTSSYETALVKSYFTLIDSPCYRSSSESIAFSFRFNVVLCSLPSSIANNITLKSLFLIKLAINIK